MVASDSSTNNNALLKFILGLTLYDVFRILFIVYLVMKTTFYFSTHVLDRFVWTRKTIKGANRVLLVTAHPDDECMFFGPTILGFLKARSVQFYVLCLSQGDYVGKGCQRKAELWNSCIKLGIPSENVTLLNYEHLKDDPSIVWPIEIVRRVLLSHVCSHHIDTIITFDENGVSGHLNHIACYKSVESLISSKLLPPYCKAFALDSVNVFRKYVLGLWLLDVPLSYLFNRFMYVANGGRRSLLIQAMECHQSQNVWFRKVYLIFSRYLIINTLSPILDDGQRQTFKNCHRKLD